MKHLFERSKETRALVEFFRTLPISTPVSFAQISKAVRFQVSSTLTAYHSARRAVERDHGIVIEGIRGHGCNRLPGDKISESGERDLGAIRRRAKRGAKRQEIAIAHNLDQEHMLRSTELLSRFRIIGDTSSPFRSNRLKTETPEAVQSVDVRGALRAI